MRRLYDRVAEIRRELERVRALLNAVPGDVDPALTALLESPEGPDD